MPAQLVAIGEGISIAIDKPILLLGRHAECDIQLNSRKISRRHCCLAQIDDYLVIRDLESTNGIRINGERVVEGILREGDELVIGNFTYRVSNQSEVVDAVRPGHTTMPGMMPGQRDPLEDADEPVALDESGRPMKK